MMTPKRALRLNQMYGPGNPFPIGKTKFNADIVYHEGGEEFIPGTNIPRLRLMKLGGRITIGFADEVEAIVEALRAARDAKAEARTKAARAEVRP